MNHLARSFFISTRDLAPRLDGCRTVRVGDYWVGAFSDALLPPEGLDRLSISFETLAAAQAPGGAQNAAAIDRGTLVVRGSDMNTQCVYYILVEGRDLVVFNDLFLARYLLEELGCHALYDPRRLSEDLTFFAPVSRLLAGQELTAEVERRAPSVRMRRFSRVLEAEGGFHDDIERSKAALLGSLEGAVRRGLGGEATAHNALSGGIDSGTIACLIRRTPCRLKAYTLGTDWGDEHEEARETADFLGIELERVHVSTEEIRREIPAVIRYFHFIEPESVEIALVAPCLYRKLHARSPTPRLFLTGYGSDLLNGGGVTDAERAGGLHADLLKGLGRTQLSNELSNLAAMHCGVRVYHPFLQTEVVSCALRVPPDHKIRGGRDKLYMREMMSGMLPERTVWRRKLAAHHGTGLARHLGAIFRGPGDRGGADGYQRLIQRVHEDIFCHGRFA
ncbi:MAG: hypothetical protein IT372_38755 [Polyangiaceae bacterium]|nr:hypothetical protein [Polyangiaceae bacterium]